MYAGSTAPASTRIWPASRMASSLPVAVPGVLIWDTFRMSLMRWGSFESDWHRGGFGRCTGDGSGRRGGVGDLEFLDDLVVLGAAHEVGHRDVLGGGRLVPRP